MTVGNDGGWCWITPGANGGLNIHSRQITAAPSHGETAIFAPDAKGIVRIAYKPTSEYIGTDQFSVGLGMLHGVATLDLTVDVVE
jgi:hypothetical protein